MKRIVMLALAGVMALVLGACGESTPPKPETTSAEVAVEQNAVEQNQDTQQQDNQNNQEQQAEPAAPTNSETPASGE